MPNFGHEFIGDGLYGRWGSRRAPEELMQFAGADSRTRRTSTRYFYDLASYWVQRNGGTGNELRPRSNDPPV